MADDMDDEGVEIQEGQSQKDKQRAEQAKALDSMTDAVGECSGRDLQRGPNQHASSASDLSRKDDGCFA